MDNNLTQFQALGVSDNMLQALTDKGFVTPTAIQSLAIPLLLSGEKDLIGQALTGTGKTAAFGIPILQELECSDAPGALILSPTRELSMQISEELTSLRGTKNLRIASLYGGQAIQLQLAQLKRGVDIAVGTPGRIMDLYRRGALKLDKLRFAVLDEADEMLDMGFVDDIREILEVTNPDKRMLMFSATMPEEITAIAETFMRPGYEVARTGDEPTNPKLTEQFYYEVKRENKIDALTRVIDATPDIYALVFCRTRADVDDVTNALTGKNYSAEALHGEISQAQRTRVIEAFKKRKFPLLIATDVAARGIDVNDLTHVINFSLPHSSETYIHRIGRTGRAGKHGVAISFATPRENRRLKSIERDIATPIPRKQLPEFADIVEARKNLLAEKLSLIMAEKEFPDEYISFAEELCVLGDHPAQVLAAMLQYHFKDSLCRPPEPPPEEEKKKLLLFAGRVNGVNLPDLLREIFDRTQIRGNELGKIIIRADKTFIHAAPKDAERILRAFKNDPDFRFKLDDGRDDRKDGKRQPRRRDNNDSDEISPRREKRARKQETPPAERTAETKQKFSAKSDKKQKNKKAAETSAKRKPLREEFWSLIESGE